MKISFDSSATQLLHSELGAYSISVDDEGIIIRYGDDLEYPLYVPFTEVITAEYLIFHHPFLTPFDGEVVECD